uniref:Putative conserved secreted protein n=1 Tax=Culex tarsalis TaxID=7177 RepID=A0A1Q3FNV5_CULTA
MSKLAISALVIVASVVVVQGSLFGPGGPFGQPAAQPGVPFPGFGYQPATPFFPSFGPPAFAPSPYTLASRTAVAVPAGLPASSGTPAVVPFRPKPSLVMQRLETKRNTLPEDLLEQYEQLLVTLEEGYAACDSYYPTFGFFAGRHRRCVVLAKVAVEQAANVLEQEANDRAAAQQAAEQAAAQAAAEQAAAEQAAAQQAAEEAAAEQAAAQAAAEQAAAEQAAAEQAAAEQATAEQAAAEETEQAAVAEESTTEEAAVVDEAEVDVAEVADQTDNVEEPVVEEDVVADAEHVNVEEATTVA